MIDTIVLQGAPVFSEFARLHGRGVVISAQ